VLPGRNGHWAVPNSWSNGLEAVSGSGLQFLGVLEREG
jgi:hypothetical protein